MDKKITPEMVVEAFKVTGLKPMRGDYYPATGCACALGAVYKNTKDAQFPVYTYFDEEYGFSYTQAFACGFDGAPDAHWAQGNPEAYEDGKKAWEAVAKEIGVD